jgi:hypothetical protein
LVVPCRQKIAESRRKPASQASSENAPQWHFSGPKTIIGGDAHGRAPIFRPVITFLPSRHRNKVDRFINRRGIIGLVGHAA